MFKPQCWEVMKCNNQTNCVVAINVKYHNLHDGKNAGRACWLVAGTFSKDKSNKNSCINKVSTCMNCNFFAMVQEQEQLSFKMFG